MAKQLDSIWPIEPHTRIKHAILKRYLQAWIPIMTRTNGRVLFIDGFAGPGSYAGGEPGSPAIALEAALKAAPHMAGKLRFLFIEKDEARFNYLKAKIAEREIPPKIEVEALQGKFDDTLRSMLDRLDEQKKTLAPTFAFIDPFGFSHTPLSIVRRIVANPKCEVLITFMYEEINRFLNHPDQPAHYDALFGCSDWKAGIPLIDPNERRRLIHDLYKRKLEESGLRYVRSFEMVNSGNRTDYFLFFGTNNLLGLKKMKEAMWAVDEVGGGQFSDTTDFNQILLFEKAPDFKNLEQRILRKFSGQQVAVEKVEEFVVVETPFRETHYKKEILRKLESQTPPGITIVARSGQGRKGTYPPRTIIKFS